MRDIDSINSKITNSNNKIIYLYDDLVEISENIKNKYSEGSFIVKYGDETIVCFSNSHNKVEGNLDNLEFKTINNDTEKCKFTIFTSLDKNYKEKYHVGEVYLKKYLSDKYGISIYNVDYIEECILYNCSGNGHYNIESSVGNFTAQLYINNNKLIETDDYNNYSNS